MNSEQLLKAKALEKSILDNENILRFTMPWLEKAKSGDIIGMSVFNNSNSKNLEIPFLPVPLPIFMQMYIHIVESQIAKDKKELADFLTPGQEDY